MPRRVLGRSFGRPFRLSSTERNALVSVVVGVSILIALVTAGLQRNIPLSADPRPTTTAVAPTEVANEKVQLERDKAAYDVAKAQQEVTKLQLENQKNHRSLGGWLWSVAASLNVAALAAVLAGAFGIFSWFHEQGRDRDKATDERYAALVQQLGSKEEGGRNRRVPAAGDTCCTRTAPDADVLATNAHQGLRGGRSPRPAGTRRQRSEAGRLAHLRREGESAWGQPQPRAHGRR
jgi:hypothetical protein